MVVITIDGNIGSGKSTQIDLLSSKYTVKKEPIDKWPLKEFYEDPSRWAFLLQVVILQTMRKPEGDGINITERSPYSTRDVFWKNLHESGTITDTEYHTFMEEHRIRSWFPEVVIYLRTGAEQCREHIKKREQAGDFGVTPEYLGKLEKLYDQSHASWGEHVEVVNGNQSIENVHKDIMTILTKYE